MNYLLVLITANAIGNTSIATIPGYSESRCHEAAEQFEQQGFVKKGGDRIARFALCIQGPGNP